MSENCYNEIQRCIISLQRGKTMKRFAILGVLMAAGFLLASCAANGVAVSNTWKLPGFSHGSYQKVLVVGASSKLDRRQLFEEILVEEFKRRGIEAVPSYLVVHTGGALSQKNLTDAAHRAEADCVLITGLVDIKKEIKVEPGTEGVIFKPVTMYPDSEYLNPRYEVGYAEIVVHEPPAIIAHLKVSMETQLFDAATARMVWYAITTSGEVDDLRKATATFADVLIKALSRDKLL